ncbi:hypothetical protein BpHYR1_001250 [Brachionus plicatilis]|uniref:Uncharacterized protein n=1 Tax=Brachionus plicatilis TaxID=10195 RepID=A0A3M7S5G7_BRAPC|nr:hypothetical protein BpHYR1_001250 [Brachionus plicatilis]
MKLEIIYSGVPDFNVRNLPNFRNTTKFKNSDVIVTWCNIHSSNIFQSLLMTFRISTKYTTLKYVEN